MVDSQASEIGAAAAARLPWASQVAENEANEANVLTSDDVSAQVGTGVPHCGACCQPVSMRMRHQPLTSYPHQRSRARIRRYMGACSAVRM